MKAQLNEYYQCSPRGYVKHQNLKLDHLPTIKEVPVFSKCNQLLPHIVHPIEVKQPIPVTSFKQTTIQIKEPIKDSSLRETKKQSPLGSLNYSFSTYLMQNQMRNLQRDEVSSVHIDDKTSARTKVDQTEKDLMASTYTYQRKPKYDMKRSLFQTNRSNLTTDAGYKENEKFDMIIHQLAKEKGKREEFQRKYQALFELLNQSKKESTTVNSLEETLFQQKLLNPTSSPALSKHKNYQIRSETESQSQTQKSQDRQERKFVEYRKGRRKYSSPSKIIINLGSEILQRNLPSISPKFAPSQESIAEITEIKGSLQLIQTQIATLHGNMEYLERKTQEQEQKRQKQLLLQELKEKQRKIEQIAKQNQRIKQMNELLISKKSHSQTKQITPKGIYLEKNTIIASFIVSLFVALLITALRGSMC